MNATSKRKLVKLERQCADALRDKSQQSVRIFRGEMWAILAAAHELRKRDVLPDPPVSSPVLGSVPPPEDHQGEDDHRKSGRRDARRKFGDSSTTDSTRESNTLRVTSGSRPN